MPDVSPPRCAVVWTPAWPLTAAVLAGRAGRGEVVEPTAPLAVLHAQRVVCCSPTAWREGVRPGQRRRQAQGACPHLVLVPHDPDRDARHFEPVVRSIGTLVPLVDVESPGMVLLATRGPSRYVGGDHALAARLTELASHGLADAESAGGRAGIGIADGRVAAQLAARHAVRSGVPVIVESADTVTFLAPHPVSLLVDVAGCSPDMVDVFVRLGLRTFGDLAALSPEHLLDRFGAAGPDLHRIVTGTDDRPPSAATPPPDLSLVRVFDDPVTLLDPLVFSAKSLADQLHAELAATGRVCTRLVVEAESEHGESSRRSWYRAEGLRSPDMVDRIRWQLDGWINGADPPSAGVTLVRLVPTDVRDDSGVQEGFWGGRSRADDAAAKAITRVIGVLGPQAVTMASWCGGRDPRRAVEFVPVAEIGADGRTVVVPPSEAPIVLWPGAVPVPSPAVVLVEPSPIEVFDVDGGSVAVSGRGVVNTAPARVRYGDADRSVLSWAGPWPVDERWWHQRSHRAARFQLVLGSAEGSRALLVEVSQSRWWLIAEYD